MLFFVSLLLAVGTIATPNSSLVFQVNGATGELNVTLQRITSDGASVDVAQGHLAKGRRSVTYDGLQEGEYALVVRGGGPLEVAGAHVTVSAGRRRRASIAIHPVRVEGTASIGGKPLSGTTLVFFNRAERWTAEITTDGEGRFTADVWQPGSMLIKANGGPLTTSYASDGELRAGRFELAIPAHQVTGKLVDAASGRGIGDALVFLRSMHGELQSTVRTKTEADGTFLFSAVAAGGQRITVIAPDFLIPSPVDFSTREGDPPKEVTIRLDTGAPRTFRVFRHDGTPAADVEVDAAVDGEIRAMDATDADGRVTIPMPADQDATIYVIPRDASFTIVPRKADRVELPLPTASLRVSARSLDGRPIPNIALLMSYDGVIVPPPVARRIKDLDLMTNAQGEAMLRNIPPGYYQFWPYRGEREALDIIASSPLEAPIALDVKTGENAVAVDFRRVQ